MVQFCQLCPFWPAGKTGELGEVAWATARIFPYSINFYNCSSVGVASVVKAAAVEIKLPIFDEQTTKRISYVRIKENPLIF